MTLRIGTDLKKTRERGFTLIEVMIAVTVLSVTLVVIQAGFLQSASLLSRVSRTLDAQQWAEEKMWQVKEDLFYADEPSPGEGLGAFRASGKEYSWTAEARPLSLPDEYAVNVRVNWLDSGRPVETQRELYVNSVQKS